MKMTPSSPTASPLRFVRSSLAAAVVTGLVLAVAACDTGSEAVAGKEAGLACVASDECQSHTCSEGKCAPGMPLHAADGVKNGDESDVDCGGAAAKCGDGKHCNGDADCASDICIAAVCKPPSPTDGRKNGDETDVDCGGSTAPKCAVDKACAKNEDCGSDACSHAKKCVAFRSCTGHFGGDTCGAGDTGSGGEQHESCCTMVRDPKLEISVGKYYVTAGRMRAFVERFGGNIRGWADAEAKDWSEAWLDELPSTMEEALDKLGPNTKRGCSIPGKGGRTYWQEAANGDPAETNDLSKDVLDEKALNCVPWFLAQALCRFDGGGRLASSAEILAIMRNNGETSWPWGNAPAYKFPVAMEQIVHAYSYQTPNPPDGLRQDGKYGPLDRAFWIAPPGRRPLGANEIGVQDGIGNLMPWVNDAPYRFTWTGSWEDSHPPAGVRGARALDSWPPVLGDFKTERDGYWAIGARCVIAP